MNEYGKQVKKQMDTYMDNPDSIDKEISDIQNATHGVEVRGALAAGVSKSFTKSKAAEDKSIEAYDITKNLLDETFDSAALEVNFEQRLNDEIENMQPELTNHLISIDSQLEQVDTDIGDKTTLPEWLQVNLREATKHLDDYIRQFGVNVKQPPFSMIGDGTDDPTLLQDIIDYANTNKLQIYLPEGEYPFENLTLYTGTVIVGAGRQKSILTHVGNGTAIKSNNNSGYITLDKFTLDMGAETEIGIDMSGWFNSINGTINIFGSGNGTGVKISEGQTKSSYYMNILGIYIANTHTGFLFGESANSNRIVGCRTLNVRFPVVFESENINNVTIVDNAFEQFEIGVTLNGRSNAISNNRFENSTTSGIAIQKVGGYGNFTSENHYQGVSTEFEDISVNKDTIRLENLLDMGGRSIQNTNHLTLNPVNTNPPGQKGRISYLERDSQSLPSGLYTYDNTWRKIRVLKVVTNSSFFPDNPQEGEEYWVRSRKKPYYYDSADNVWRDAMGNPY